MKLGEKIGQGLERAVYRHPLRPECCIKIATRPAGTIRNELELDFFRTSAPAIAEHIVGVHGWIETERGPGVVYDLIADPDGKPSLTLSECVSKRIVPLETIVRILHDLNTWIDRNRVTLADSNPDNILLQRCDSGYRPVIIDGFGQGNKSLKWQLRMAWPWLMLRKNAHARRKMERRLQQLAAD